MIKVFKGEPEKFDEFVAQLKGYFYSKNLKHVFDEDSTNLTMEEEAYSELTEEAISNVAKMKFADESDAAWNITFSLLGKHSDQDVWQAGQPEEPRSFAKALKELKCKYEGMKVDKLTIFYTTDKTRSRRVFINNLPWSVTWQMLKDFFRECGDVVYANVFMKYGRSRGLGLVEFSSVMEAQSAIDTMNGAFMDGRCISVREDGKDKELKERNTKPLTRNIVTGPRNVRPVPSSTLRHTYKNDNGRALFVHNLPYRFTSEDLHALFDMYFPERIESCVVLMRAKRSLGSAVVVMLTDEDAYAAINFLTMNLITVDSRKIEIRYDHGIR